MSRWWRGVHTGALVLACGAACAGPPLRTGESGRLTSDGLWYRVTGRGPAVVLVHGANLDSRTWEPVAARLSANHTVLVTDLRLHGRSADHGGPISFSRDMLRVMNAAGLRHATIAGHSLGAAVAIDLALAAPERVSRLVLIGPSVNGFVPTRPVPGLGPMAAAMRAGDWAGAAREYAQSPVMRLYRDTSAAALMRIVVASNMALLRADRARLVVESPTALQRLRALKVPVTVVTGTLDSTSANDAATVILQGVASSCRVTLQGCGHIMPLDCPTALVAALRPLPSGTCGSGSGDARRSVPR